MPIEPTQPAARVTVSVTVNGQQQAAKRSKRACCWCTSSAKRSA